MSVERMEMMNIIGRISDLDSVSMEIVKSGCVQIVNALNEINQNDFTVIMPDQNTDILTNLCFIRPYTILKNLSDLNQKTAELMDFFSIQKGIRKKYLKEKFSLNDITTNIGYIYDEVMEYKKKLEALKAEIEKDKLFIENIKSLENAKIDFNELKNMNFLDFKIGKLSKENFDKLKDNIENISAIIYKLRTAPGYYIFISLTPKVLESEVDRIFKSLNFEEISLPENKSGIPKQLINEINIEIQEKEKLIENINKQVLELKAKYAEYIDKSYSRLKMYEKIQLINSDVACTNEFFYMAGWVPESEKKSIQKRLAAFGDKLIVIFKPKDEVTSSIIPPTKLKNNWFVRPFESIVKMYGIPSYDELDPTAFVALSYMFMFGYMFGDVGQGFIFLLAGILLVHKFKRPNLGGVLSRIGASSMVFGVLFGSVFGNEDIIKHPFIRPMDNINAVLIGGVIVGIIFSTVGFILNLVNSFKQSDLEEGVFGKDGLVGLAFYWIILLTAYSMYQGNMMLPVWTVIIILCMLLALMVLKQPLANMIERKPYLYAEAPGDYFIESGFGVLETLISMLSNTVSFIRVGAFALNHVGLFVAFATVARLIRNSTGSVAVLVLGNIIIICLEGLVVFIQGLRLEYYELFSKYYSGDGEEFNPVMLKYTNYEPKFNIVYNTENAIKANNVNSDITANM